MSSPSPHLRDYQRYSEDVPSSGIRPPSREDLDNYFDHALPAPSRLSGNYPLNYSPNGSPRGSMENVRGGLSPQPAFGGSGPRYLSPLAASAATETAGVGMRQSNYSEMSMVGLNSTPGLQRKSTWLQKQTTYKRKNHRLVCCLNLLKRLHYSCVLLVCDNLLSDYSPHHPRCGTWYLLWNSQ